MNQQRRVKRKVVKEMSKDHLWFAVIAVVTLAVANRFLPFYL